MRQERTSSIPAVSHIPAILVSWLALFRPCFSGRIWNRILVLVAGTVLAPGKRTVTRSLRVLGLADEPGFSRYHEALNRAPPPSQGQAAGIHAMWREGCCVIFLTCCGLTAKS
jgi:hypothetical protein